MRIAATTVSMLLVSGCVSSGTKVDETAAAQFQKGVTTQPDVEKALGPPQNRTVLNDGTRSIMYIYTHAHAKASSFIPVVGLLAGGAKGQTAVVTFHFDTSGKLLDYSSSQSTVDAKSGLAAGPEK